MPSHHLQRLALLALCCASLLAARTAPARAPFDAFHAQLEASTPAEDDTLRVPLDTVRLEFSARVTVDLTRLVIALPDGDSIVLSGLASSDDGTVIVAPAPRLDAGAHVLHWRTTSADGHLLTGEIPFAVAPEAVPPPPVDAAATRDSIAAAAAATPAVPPPSSTDFGALLPLLRALGTGLLLALAGGLLFASRATAAADALSRLLTAFALAAPLAIFAELVTWTMQVAGTLDLELVMQLSTGRALLARLVLAAAALAVWVLTRSARAAALVAFLAVLAGGGLGHAAVTSPVLSVPLRAVHMAAAAVWLGGLLTLARVLGSGPAQRPMLRNVSTAALWSFGFVAVTGVAQAVLMLGSTAALVETGYGRIILVKATGLLALAAFGFHHRRLIETIPDAGDGAALRASTRREILLFMGLIVVSAVLAFAPLPE